VVRSTGKTKTFDDFLRGAHKKDSAVIWSDYFIENAKGTRLKDMNEKAVKRTRKLEHFFKQSDDTNNNGDNYFQKFATNESY
jgi:hypothetical protein